jgi:uncharacterized protein (DUF3084 family)
MVHIVLTPAPSARLAPFVQVALLACFLVASAAQAQSTSRAPRPDPLNAQAPVPPLTYQSSLRMTTRQADDKVITWREANDNVARIGGWRVYAREAQQAAPPASSPVSSPTKEPPR